MISSVIAAERLVFRGSTTSTCFNSIKCSCFYFYYAVPPAISLEVMDQAQNETNTASFTCQATGEPVPTISWYFNDVPLDATDTKKYTVSVISSNVTTNSGRLTIVSVQSSDVGTYTCNATNVVSSDTISGVLTVNGENYFIM